MYEYDDGEEGGRSIGRLIATLVGVVALALVGWFVVKPGLSSDDAGGGPVIPASADGGTTTTVGADDGTAPPPDDSTATTDVDATSEPTVKTDKPVTSDAQATTLAPTTAAPTTAAPTTAAPQAPPPTAPYDTLPDGSPAPALAIFDVSSITLTGAVPDQAAKDRLEFLAIANAKPGQAETVSNLLTINPAVPRNVGVRVVELTSVRFPAGSAEVLPEHGLELDRVVGIMNALPNITALVIGHADQRGDDLANYAISEQRANSVKNYVAAHGIAPDRLSSRAVGENDLLTLNDDAAALALNRRTEFVFYGLLLG